MPVTLPTPMIEAASLSRKRKGDVTKRPWLNETPAPDATPVLMQSGGAVDTYGNYYDQYGVLTSPEGNVFRDNEWYSPHGTVYRDNQWVPTEQPVAPAPTLAPAPEIAPAPRRGLLGGITQSIANAQQQVTSAYPALMAPDTYIRDELTSQKYMLNEAGQITGWNGVEGALPPGLTVDDVTAGVQRIEQRRQGQARQDLEAGNSFYRVQGEGIRAGFGPSAPEDWLGGPSLMPEVVTPTNESDQHILRRLGYLELSTGEFRRPENVREYMQAEGLQGALNLGAVSEFVAPLSKAYQKLKDQDISPGLTMIRGRELTIRDINEGGAEEIRKHVPGLLGRALAEGWSFATDPINVAGLALGGESLAANFLGKGTLSAAAYMRALFGAGVGSQVVGEAAREAGLPEWTGKLAGGLVGGGIGIASSHGVRSDIPTLTPASRKKYLGELDTHEDALTALLKDVQHGLDNPELTDQTLRDKLVGEQGVLVRGLGVINAARARIMDATSDIKVRALNTVRGYEDEYLNLWVKEIEPTEIKVAAGEAPLGYDKTLTPIYQRNIRAVTEARTGQPLEVIGFRQEGPGTRREGIGTWVGIDPALAAMYGQNYGNPTNILEFDRGGPARTLTVAKVTLRNPLVVDGGHSALLESLPLYLGGTDPVITTFRQQVDAINVRIKEAEKLLDDTYVGAGPQNLEAKERAINELYAERMEILNRAEAAMLGRTPSKTLELANWWESNKRGFNSEQDYIRADKLIRAAALEQGFDGVVYRKPSPSYSLINQDDTEIAVFADEALSRTAQVPGLLDRAKRAMAEAAADGTARWQQVLADLEQLGDAELGGGTAVQDAISAIRKLIPSQAVLQPLPGSSVGALRGIDDVIATQVVFKDKGLGKFGRIALGWSSINKGVMLDQPLERLLLAEQKQIESYEYLTQIALATMLDVHAQHVTTLRGFAGLFRLDAEGMMSVRNVDGVKSKVQWGDVFSRPGMFDLSKRQMAYINSAHKLADDLNAYRVEIGMKPLRKDASEEGWFYVPRRLTKYHGMPVEGRTNFHLQRLNDTIEESMAKGNVYSNDPRGVYEAHILANYREILDKQLSDYAVSHSVAASDILRQKNPAVVDAFEAATATKAAATKKLVELQRQRRALASVVAEPKTVKGVTVAQRKIRANNRAMVKDIEDEMEVLKAMLPEMTVRWQRAKGHYNNALKLAEEASFAPADLFGGAVDQEIPVRQWRNRFFKKEDVDAAEKFIKSMSPLEMRDKDITTLTQFAFRAVGAISRRVSAGVDFALPFIHLLPVMFRRPDVWTKALVGHYAAFFDPTLQAHYMRNNRDVFMEMAKYNLAPGDVEFFTSEGGVGLGGVLNLIPEGVGGRQIRGALRAGERQTMGRFMASYNTGLGIARAELWKSTRFASKLSPDMRAQLIRNLTGGLSTRALGTPTGQRALESFWLAFSPKLLRSTVALVAEVPKVWMPGDRGNAARESVAALGMLMGGASLVYYLVGKGMGRSDKEILEGLDPRQGKRFMAYKVGEDWIGVGGQVRALVQFSAKIGAAAYNDIEGNHEKGFARFLDVGDDAWFDNPLLQFYSTRGAPGLTFAGGAVEAYTGIDVLPYKNLSGTHDLLAHVGKSTMPFSLGAIQEEQSTLAVIAGMLGARTSHETLTEERDRQLPLAFDLAVERGEVPAEMVEALRGQKWTDMTGRERELLKTAITDINPDLLPELERRARESGSTFQRARDTVQEYWKDAEPNLDAMAAGVFAGKATDPQAVYKRLKDLEHDASAPYRTEEYKKALEKLPADDLYKALDYIYTLSDNPKFQKGGIPDWDRIERETERVKHAYDVYDPKLGARLRFNLATEGADPESHILRQTYQRSQQLFPLYYKVEGATPAATTIARENYRAQNPETDFLLWLFGLTTTVQSEAAAKLAQKFTRNREVKIR